MRISKILISVFLITFLIGYILVTTTKQIPAPAQTTLGQPEKVAVFQLALPPPIVENGFEQESNKEDWADGTKYKIKLLTVGEGFHGDEVEAKSGEKWLGLFRVNDKYFLRLTPITIRRVYDPILDGDEEKYAKQKTGKSVSIEGMTQPTFLLKNAGMLRTGEIKTLFRGFSYGEADGSNQKLTLFEKGFARKFQLGVKKYVLRVEEKANSDGEKFLVLVLETEEAKQTLHSIKSEYTDNLGALYWVGDLDNDGKPDFFADLYVHENVVYQNLFLSSKAAKGKLVKKVAIFATTGC